MFPKNIDEQIREAIARGEFDNLPGKGKPLDLDAYFATPGHLRMGYSILKSADIVPEEMELLRQIEHLKRSLDSSTMPMEKNRFESNSLRSLQTLMCGWNATGKSGKPSQLMKPTRPVKAVVGAASMAQKELCLSRSQRW